jgi:hypothetical protein
VERQPLERQPLERQPLERQPGTRGASMSHFAELIGFENLNLTVGFVSLSVTPPGRMRFGLPKCSLQRFAELTAFKSSGHVAVRLIILVLSH